ncbi:MAG: HD domain-containing protein [Pirellulaceae bacterium]|nr:HD domain-containing protein [Pirellulaceae bacterium]
MPSKSVKESVDYQAEESRESSTTELPLKSLILLGFDHGEEDRILQILGAVRSVATLRKLSEPSAIEIPSEDETPDLLILNVRQAKETSEELAFLDDICPHELPVLLVFDSLDTDSKQQALRLGFNHFIDRPFHDIDLIARVQAISNPRLRWSRTLASTPSDSITQDQIEHLMASRQDLLFCLARAGEHSNAESHLHLLRVGLYVGAISEQLGFDPNQVQLLEQAALLHDVGKIQIPDLILLKPSELTEKEYLHMMRHCEFGRDIIHSAMDSKWRTLGHYRTVAANRNSPDTTLLRIAAQIALCHHERWDGTGYPRGLAGEAIPIEARITAVADVFDALSSSRPYKSAFMPDACLKMMLQEKGKHFDPRIMNAFVSCRDRLWSIRQQVERSEGERSEGERHAAARTLN